MLTVKHPSFSYPDNKTILENIDRYGYNYYFPKNIFNDLLNVCSHYFIDGNIENCFKGNYSLAFNIKLVELLKSIDLSIYLVHSPIEMAIMVLEDLSKIYDLRKLDDLEDIEPEFMEPDNFVSEPDDIDKDLLIDRDIDKDLIAEVLKRSLLIPQSFRKTKEVSNKRTNMKSISEMLSTSKKEWVRPDFKYKLFTKTLKVNSSLKANNDKVVLLLEDATSSMAENEGRVIAHICYKLLMEDDRIIHHYRYHGQSVEFKELKTYSDKLNQFRTDKDYYKEDNNYSYILKKILSNYESGEAIIISDGEDHVPPLKFKVKINCLSNRSYQNQKLNLVLLP